MTCESKVQFLSVATMEDATGLANALLNCEGAGSFVVEWTGWVTVETTIHVANGTTLEIVSSNSSDAAIDGDGAQQLFDVYNATLSISNVKLENGNGTYGGAIFGRYADVRCTGCRFFGNRASEEGGAINVKDSDVSFTGETYCLQNSAGSDGGFLSATESSVVVFEGTSIFQDNISDGRGGVIHSFEAEEIKFNGRSRFYNNAADHSGGAIWAQSTSLSFSREDSTVEFVNNSVATLFGGALALAGKEPLTMNVSALFKNNSASTGGAVYLSGRATNSIISRTRFVSNSASLSGGALVMNRNGGGVGSDTADPVVVRNCTFEDNHALGNGGAIVVASGNVEIDDIIFRNNIAGNLGGAIMADSGYALDLLKISSCHLLYNRAAAGPAISHVGSAVVETVMLFYDVTFSGNQLLCGPREFLLEQSNPTIANSDLAYTTVCNSCAELSECDTCVVSDDDAVALCTDIPLHTTSPDANGTLQSLSLEEGYWRTSNISREIRRCFNQDACRGGTAETCDGVFCDKGYCAEGYTGPYCSVCADHYTWGQGYTCVKCEGTATLMTQALGIIVLLVLAAALARTWQYLISLPGPINMRETSGWRKFMARVHGAIPFQAIKIIIVAWQIITEFAAVANVTFPPYYEAFLSAVKVFNLDLTQIVSWGCYLRTNFYHRLLAITTVPLILGGLLLVTFWIAQRRYLSDANSMMEVRRRHLSVLILITFLVYSSASSTVFQTFACDPLDDGRRYLRADYRLECHQAEAGKEVPVHRMYMVYAGVMVAVYPIGIPALYGLLLWWAWRRAASGPLVRGITPSRPFEEDDTIETTRQPSWASLSERDLPDRAPTSVSPSLRQDDINIQEHHRSTMRDLWKPYKQDRIFYEVIECTRRVMLTGVIVFIYPDTVAQIGTTFLIALVFFAASEALDPYEDAQDCWVSRFGHLIVLLSMFVALMLKVDVSDEPEVGEGTYDIVLTGANVCVLIAIAGESVASIYYPTSFVGGVVDFSDD